MQELVYCPAVFMTDYGPVRISAKESQILRMAETAERYFLPMPDRLRVLNVSILESINRVARWKWERGHE